MYLVFRRIVSLYNKLVREAQVQNCAEELLGKQEWLTPKYTTWENPENTFGQSGLILDHIFRRVNIPGKITVRTSRFDVPLLQTSIPRGLHIQEKRERKETRSTCPGIMELVVALGLHLCPKNLITDNSLGIRSSERISMSDHEAVTATIIITK